MSISNECMIVNLQLGIWQGYRMDKEASAKVTQDAHAHAEAARVNKHLIPKESLKDIITASSAVRTHFYTSTLPWKDNGDRLLTRMHYQKFIEKHQELVSLFNTEVEEFLDHKYPMARDKASFRMGDLFKEDDYPEPRELRSKFYVNLDIDAVTEAGDFRVTLDKKNIGAIKQQMADAMNDRLGRAMKDVWTRLAETLGHYTRKMSTDEIFRDSTVKNLEEIIEILPALNIMDDPNLAKIILDLRQNVVGYAANDLRKDLGTRALAAGEATRIMEDMKGFMSAFGSE
jgi:5-hydroxyisourate hydrolase-like protein (transthyretin family)